MAPISLLIFLFSLYTIINNIEGFSNQKGLAIGPHEACNKIL